MESNISFENAKDLLKKYNKDEFHIRHGYTVGYVLEYFAKNLGYEDDADYWKTVGLLHDIDFEMYPNEHCVKAREILEEEGVCEDMIHSVCSHGYGICSDIEPTHQMEKVLFACDELTGLIWAYALMRPSKSTKDMKVKSLKKKFKDKKFAAGCDRDIIKKGCEMLSWDMNELFEKTIMAMRECEDVVEEIMG